MTATTSTETTFAAHRLEHGRSHLDYHFAHTGAAGRLVVLLHPWFGCWQFWTKVVAHLPTRPVLAVDFYSLGTGDWSAVKGPADLAEAVVAVLDQEGLTSVDVVGNSVGGIVAQVIAARHPDLVNRLVLIGTGASTDGALPEFAAAVDRWIDMAESGGADREAIASVVDMLHTADIDEDTQNVFVDAVARTDAGYIAQILSGARTLDLRPELSSISAPTLVVRGSEDCARSQRHVDDLVNGIEGATAVEMAGAGHSPMVDQPVALSRLIMEHLEP